MARSRNKVRAGARWLVGLVGVGALAAATLLALGHLARDGDRRTDVGDKPGCDAGPLTIGIDVSYHQDKIAWPRVREAGVRFAFVRVSDGLTVIDPAFRTNWAGARDAHVVRGAYQFFRPDQDAIAQADLLVEALRREPGELAPAIDVEVTGGRTPAQIAASVRTWLDRVRTRLGVEPIVYASPDFWRDRVGSAKVPSRLWVAHYTDGCPRVPAPWAQWTFWQHSKTGRVPGIKRPVDLDVFAGTIDDLRRRAPPPR